MPYWRSTCAKAWNDQPAADALSAAFPATSFVETLLRLNAAADDPDIKGVFVRAAEMNIGSSRAEELRTAFLRLRAKDKFVIAHSQGFLASGPSAYRAISAATRSGSSPAPAFEAPGITFETMFIGGADGQAEGHARDRAILRVQGRGRSLQGGWLHAANAETAMSELATSVWTHSVADIAADRKMTPEAMRVLLEASPYSRPNARLNSSLSTSSVIPTKRQRPLSSARAKASCLRSLTTTRPATARL
jgi:protease-4